MVPDRAANLTIAVLTAILLGAAVVTALFFDRSRRKYHRSNQAHLDPLGPVGYSMDPAEPAEYDPNQTTVVFFGDSRARDWTPPDTAPGFRFVNRGIGGQTSEQVLARFDAQVMPLKPDVVVVQVGINELKTIPSYPHRQAAIIERCQANIETIARKSHALGASVVLTTVLPIDGGPPERPYTGSAAIAAAVATVNRHIEALQGAGVTILDSSLLTDEAGVIVPEYSLDMLHLTPAGYAALNEQLQPILAAFKK